MKVNSIIFCVLVYQVRASFFDDFRGVMWSVEDSFSRLISDVVTDVRETIGCTILAVKQVLALGGVFHESSDYDARCGGARAKVLPSHIATTEINIIPTISLPPTPPPPTQPPPIRSPLFTDTYMDNVIKDTSLAEIVSDKNHGDSIKKVNDNVHDGIKGVGNALEHKSDQLTKINTIIRSELSHISKKSKKELSAVEYDIDHPTLQTVWGEISVLHKIEVSHKNSPEAVEIRHMLQEILSTLRGVSDQLSISPESVNETDSNNTFKQIKNTLLEMGAEDAKEITDDNANKEISNIEKKNTGPPTDGIGAIAEIASNKASIEKEITGIDISIQKELINAKTSKAKEVASVNANTQKEITEDKIIKQNEMSSPKAIIQKHPTYAVNEMKTTQIPVTFKNVAKKIIDETGKTFRLADSSQQEYDSVTSITTANTITAESTAKNINVSPESSSDYSLLEIAPKGSESHKKSINEVREIIKQSRQTDAIINKLFGNTKEKHTGTSVFDNPDLFNFDW